MFKQINFGNDTNYYLRQFLSYFVFLFLLIVSIFTRSFIGITVSDFRLGEIIIGGGLLLSLVKIIYPNISKSINFGGKNFLNIYRFIVIYGLINFGLNFQNFNLYFIKSSSYIWTISFIFLGVFIGKIYNNSKYILFFFTLTPLVIYIFQTGNYPNFVIDIFIKYSDKFEFMKSADMVIIIIISYLFIKESIKNLQFKFFYFNFYVFLFLPITLINSRGAVLGLLVFWFIEFLSYYDFLNKNKKYFTAIFFFNILIFSLSALRVADINFDLDRSPEITNLPDVVESITSVKNTQDVFLSFYFANGRIMSTDSTTNWRLDIWQDVVEDLRVKNILFTGYGHQEIIPVMKDPSAPGRLGRDGLNENVHNYFVTVLARGGLINLIMFIFLHYLIFKQLKFNLGISAYSYIVPCLLISSLDITMDGVQFPLLYFFFTGYFSLKKY